MWAFVALPLLWAQEEGRSHTNVPVRRTPIRPATQAPEQEEVVIMETISGKVVSAKGEAQKSVRIWFVDRASGRVLGETRTDDKGNFAMAIQHADTIIVRMSREGKEFSESMYSLSELTRSDLELIFEP